MVSQKEIGTFIAELRKEKHFTQNQLGERLGVTNKIDLRSVFSGFCEKACGDFYQHSNDMCGLVFPGKMRQICGWRRYGSYGWQEIDL